MKNTENTEVKLEFSLRLQALANKKNLTQVDISDSLGVSTGRVGNWFQGRNKPKSPIKERLAELLGVSVQYLSEGIPMYTDNQEYRTEAAPSSSSVIEHSFLDLLKEGASSQHSNSLTSLKKINNYLLPWLEAATQNPDVAAHILNQLKLNLPHYQIKVIESDPSES